MFRVLLLTVDYTATLEVTISAPLCPEAKLSLFFFFFQPRKQLVHFHNPRQSKDASITIPEKY